MKILIAGMLCLDLTPEIHADLDLTPGQMVPSGPMDVRLGGPVFNVGSALHQLGLEVGLSARVGDDILGSLLWQRLARSGLNLTGCETAKGASCAYSLVLQTPGVDRTYWHNVGANGTFDGNSTNLHGVDVIHIGYPAVLPGLMQDDGAPLRRLLVRAKEAGVATSLDLSVVHSRSPLASLDWESILSGMMDMVDFISPSIDDLNSFLPRSATTSLTAAAELAGQLVDQGAGVAMVTAAGNGLAIAAGRADRLRRIPVLGRMAAQWADFSTTRTAVDAPVLDTSCAGDAATSGLLCAVLRGWTPHAAADVAVNLAAARVGGTTNRYLNWLASIGSSSADGYRWTS